MNDINYCSFLVGDEGECKNSLKIIKRTNKVPSNPVTNQLNFDDRESDEEDEDGNEQQSADESEGVDKENEILTLEETDENENDIQNFDEINDIENNYDEQCVDHTEALAIITPNQQSTTVPGKFFYL